jgi:hypothetical protein
MSLNVATLTKQLLVGESLWFLRVTSCGAPGLSPVFDVNWAEECSTVARSLFQLRTSQVRSIQNTYRYVERNALGWGKARNAPGQCRPMLFRGGQLWAPILGVIKSRQGSNIAKVKVNIGLVGYEPRNGNVWGMEWKLHLFLTPAVDVDG